MQKLSKISQSSYHGPSTTLRVRTNALGAPSSHRPPTNLVTIQYDYIEIREI